jgi:hypothetical protein
MTIQSVGSVQFGVQANTYAISAATIQSDSFTVNFPTPTTPIQVTGQATAPSTFTINNVPALRSLSVNGGSANDLFIVPQFTYLDGVSQINGGLGQNSVNITLYAQDGLQATVSSGVVLQSGGASSHMLGVTNVNTRNFFLYGLAASTMSLTLLNPSGDTVINIDSVGVPTGTMMQYITGCSGQSELYISLTGGGNQTLVLGNSNQISLFGCSVRVTGSTDPSQIDTIVVQASQDSRKLIWEFGFDYIRTWDPLGDGFFNLYFTAIDRFQIQFGSGGSQVSVRQGSPPSEYLFQFPTNSTGSSLNIDANTNPILVNGSVAVSIGDTSSLVSYGPLENISSIIGIAGSR